METPILTQQERATWCLFVAQAYYRAEGSARSSDFIKHCVGISAVILDVTEHNLDWAFDCLWNLRKELQHEARTLRTYKDQYKVVRRHTKNTMSKDILVEIRARMVLIAILSDALIEVKAAWS